jgi:hypothetical protein
LSIYHIHVVHSMHCESNSIKTINEIKKSSCSFFFLIKPTDALISQIYFVKKLCVSGSSSAHHQEFSTVHLALVFVIKPTCHIPMPHVRWKTPDDGQRNCPKLVDFLDKNKFGKLVCLLVLLKRSTSRVEVLANSAFCRTLHSRSEWWRRCKRLKNVWKHPLLS